MLSMYFACASIHKFWENKQSLSLYYLFHGARKATNLTNCRIATIDGPDIQKLYSHVASQKEKAFIIGHTFCKLSENTSKSYSGIPTCNMSDHLPHFTCLDIVSNQQKPPMYMMKYNQAEASLLSFYNEIEIYLRNTHFPDELTTDPNVT